MEGSLGRRGTRPRAQARRNRIRPFRIFGRRQVARRAGAVLGTAAVLGMILPSAMAGAAVRSPGTGTPASLKALLAQAAKLSAQIDALSQQYDALRIQLTEARAQVKLAHLTIRRDKHLLAREQSSLGLIAAAGYMAGGMDPSLELLQSNRPQTMLNRASILSQLQRENGNKINLVATARKAAARARLLATQQEHRAAKLAAAMQKKVAKIQAAENQLNSKAFSQAMTIYQKTGKYPNITVTGDSVGVQALRYALTKVGDPYVWGAAGPNAFDCSGLVVWAFAQIGISLPHYTGYLWNSGVHVSRSQLEPGDLVFFFPDIGHVGIYVGGGMMLDAPTYGQPVQVQAVFWSAYVGAVRIA